MKRPVLVRIGVFLALVALGGAVRLGVRLWQDRAAVAPPRPDRALDPKHRAVATAFAEALVKQDFRAAHALTTGKLDFEAFGATFGHAHQPSRFVVHPGVADLADLKEKARFFCPRELLSEIREWIELELASPPGPDEENWFCHLFLVDGPNGEPRVAHFFLGE